VVQAAAPFKLGGRRILLIDTPGFDDTTKSDTDILKEIAAFLSSTQVQATTMPTNLSANCQCFILGIKKGCGCRV
jgi:hypothetical protein